MTRKSAQGKISTL